MKPTIEMSVTPIAALPGAGLPWELHEACAAWPEISQLDLRALADDIAAHGLRDPVTLTPDRLLLDERNRALACVMAGVDPTTVIYDGDPWLFSLSRNRHRRHLTTDQLALIAARLATRTVGNPNFAIGSGEPIGVAEAAKAPGVPETAIKSAKVVLKHGSPEEKKAVELGCAPLRKTADRIRERRHALAPSKLKPAKPTPAGDPIDAVACDIIAKCSDGQWRPLAKVASVVKVAETTARQALKSLEGCVSTRVNGVVIEYRIESGDEAHLRRSLAAKDQEIADLKNRIAEQDVEIEQLRGRLLLAELSTPPTRKQKRAEPESDTAKITVN
jgi:hypothetical protein